MTKRKKHNQSFWPFVFLAGLSSCTFGSGLHSPCPDIEWCPTIKSFEICPPEQPVIEVPDTKEPINLCTLIDIGLKNNPTSRNDWQLARAAAFNLIAAKAALYPTASGIEQFDYIDQSFGSNLGGVNTSSGGVAATTAASALKHFWDMESQINISYLLFDFGGRCASIESSRQALFAANWQFNRAIQTVIFDVANDYYTYIENKALLEARLEDLKNATEDFKAAEAQFIAGIVNKLDMLQAKSTMLQAQLNVVTQKNLVETSFVQLLFDMGLPANTHFEVVELPKNYEFQKIEIEYDLVKMLEDALILRPDLEEAYANFMEARAQVTVARSAGLPTINFAGSYEKTHYFDHPIFDSHLYESSFVIDVPIFAGWLYWANEKSALATSDAAFENIRLTEDTITQQVTDAYYNFITSAEALEYTKEYVETAVEGYDVAYGNYRAGVGTFLDLLTAQSTLADARASRIQAIAAWYQSILNISYMTGVINQSDCTSMGIKPEGRSKISDLAKGQTKDSDNTYYSGSENWDKCFEIILDNKNYSECTIITNDGECTLTVEDPNEFNERYITTDEGDFIIPIDATVNDHPCTTDPNETNKHETNKKDSHTY